MMAEPDARKVLFICVHNSGRSQMAEAFFNSLAPEGMSAISAGTQPSQELNPVAVEVMAELGIDISSQRPKLLTPEMIASADRVISMGCGVAESCPVGLTMAEDWLLDDPAGQPIEKVREIRDQIRCRVEALLGFRSGAMTPPSAGSRAERE